MLPVKDKNLLVKFNKLYIASWMIMLTAALLTGIPVLVTAVVFGGLFSLGSLYSFLKAARELELEVTVKPADAVRYQKVNVNILISHDSILPLPKGELFIERGNLPESSRARLFHGDHELKGSMEIHDQYPGGLWEKKLQMVCYTRGRHLPGQLRLKLRAPGGAAVVEKLFAPSTEVMVKPRLFSLSGEHPIKRGNSSTLSARPVMSNYHSYDYREPLDLRPFMPGDPRKLICWKKSAALGEWYVKRLEGSHQGQILVCLEFSRALFSSWEEQELALEKCFSLVNNMLLYGYRVGLLTFDGKRRLIYPASGKIQFMRIRNLFIPLNASNTISLLQYLTRSGEILPEIPFLWLTPYQGIPYLVALRKLRRSGQPFKVVTVSDNLAQEQENLSETQSKGEQSQLTPALPRINLSLRDERVVVERVPVA